MSPKWVAVADLVGVATAAIQKNCREVDECIRSTIQKWINDAPNLTIYNCTWNGLCILLKDIEKGATSQKLKQAIAADVSTLKENYSAGIIVTEFVSMLLVHNVTLKIITNYSGEAKGACKQ